MWLVDIILTGKIGYLSCHFKNAAVRARRHAQLVNNHFEHLLALIIDGTAFVDMPGGHSRIALQTVGSEPFQLDGTGFFHLGSDGSGKFALAKTGELLMGSPWNLNMQVNPVEMRAGQALAITPEFVWPTCMYVCGFPTSLKNPHLQGFKHLLQVFQFNQHSA